MQGRTIGKPAKRQSKWTEEEDARVIELRSSGLKWEDVSKGLPGRSSISCRLHYQNYLERKTMWTEEEMDKLAQLYERFKQEMWQKISEEMEVPWRAIEAKHWEMGEADMAHRAGVHPFKLAPETASSVRRKSPHSQSVKPRSRSQRKQSLPLEMNVPSAPAMYSRELELPPPPPARTGGPVLAPRRDSQSLPPTRESISEQSDYLYSAVPTLAPMQNQARPRGPGQLPSISEITTQITTDFVYSPRPSPGAPVPLPGAGFVPVNSSFVKHEPQGLKRQRSEDLYQRDAIKRRIT